MGSAASGKIVGFGEILLRLETINKTLLIQSNQLNFSFGGSEVNALIGLASMGETVGFVTRLPLNTVGQAAINFIRGYGVDTRRIVRAGDRIGLYFLEEGAGLRGSGMVMDRKNSAFAQLIPDEFNWEEIFEGASWFHITSITPALSKNAAKACMDAAKAAKEKGLTVSCDMNYRSKLWPLRKARKVMSELFEHVDIFIANQEHAKTVFGFKAPSAELKTKPVDYSGCEKMSFWLREIFKFDQVVLTLRGTVTLEKNYLGATLFNGTSFIHTNEVIVHMAERIGGGDGFAAGLIYGIRHGYPSQKRLDFALASCVAKHFVRGDVPLSGVDEIEQIATGNTMVALIR
jgi:2-dehydro-3-deoxygluconokinase